MYPHMRKGITMKRPIVEPYGHVHRERLSYKDLQALSTVDMRHISPHNIEELHYVSYNGIAFDLNLMTNCNPDYIPEGWDGRAGDVVFKISDNSEDIVIMAKIAR